MWVHTQACNSVFNDQQEQFGMQIPAEKTNWNKKGFQELFSILFSVDMF